MTLPGLFVVGTDTGVGKTAVASAIVRSLTLQARRVGVFKPAATGCTWIGDHLVSEDGQRLLAATGVEVPAQLVVPWTFEEPLAPSVAARRAGTPLTLGAILRSWASALEMWSSRARGMVIEGVGGFMCPLADDGTLADLAVAIDYPLVIVARNALGTLNHTLLTVEAARRRGLRIAGVVLNSPAAPAPDQASASNRDALWELLDTVPLLATVGYHENLDALADEMAPLDWWGRMLPARHGMQPPVTSLSGST